MEINQVLTPVWLDAIRVNIKNSNSSFIWSDGSAMLYENYLAGEPNNVGGDEYCLFIWPENKYQWNDAPCGNNIHFSSRAICEKSCT